MRVNMHASMLDVQVIERLNMHKSNQRESEWVGVSVSAP
jgi:hypothetical protein